MTIRQRTDGVNLRVQVRCRRVRPAEFLGRLELQRRAGRYEARSTGGEVTVGVKKGNSVIFTSKMKGIATGTSVMNVSTSRIVVDTTVKRSASGGDIKSHLELKK